MWLVFKLTFDVSTPFADWIDAATAGPLKRWAAAVLGGVGAPDWTVSLVNDGIIAGVGFVLVFVPVIFAMMFFITLLEASGYMARAAFVMDKAMHAIGLHGKSFIPMLLGFGCNVPAVYATRALENEKDKVLTALLIPLMSCGARLPVYVLFVGVFFPGNAGTVIWGLYVLGIALAIVMGLVFKRTLFRGDAHHFIMELRPTGCRRSTACCCTPGEGEALPHQGGHLHPGGVDHRLVHAQPPLGRGAEEGLLPGPRGQVMAPALAPIGFGTWEAASALLTGVIAKETVVGTMGEIYAPEAGTEEGPVPTLAEDARELATSFGAAFVQAGRNVFGSFGTASIAADDDGEETPSRWRCAVPSRHSRPSPSWSSCCSTCPASSWPSPCARSSAAGGGSGGLRLPDRAGLGWGVRDLPGRRLLGLGAESA